MLPLTCLFLVPWPFLCEQSATVTLEISRQTPWLQGDGVPRAGAPASLCARGDPDGAAGRERAKSASSAFAAADKCMPLVRRSGAQRVHLPPACRRETHAESRSGDGVRDVQPQAEEEHVG